MLAAVEPLAQQCGERGEIVDLRDRRDVPSRHLAVAWSIGDERNSGRRRRDTVHPRIADHDAVAHAGEARGDDTPSVGGRLHLRHLVARDDQIQRVDEREAIERDLRDLARVIRPQGGGETRRARARQRLPRARLEPCGLDGAALVVERDVPYRLAQVGRVVAAPAHQLADAPAFVARGKRVATGFDVRAHVERHRREVQRRRDQRVIEIEHADTHGGLYRIPDPDVYGCEDRPKPPTLRLVGAAGLGVLAEEGDDDCTGPPADTDAGLIGFGDENTRPPATLAGRSSALPAAVSGGRGRWYASTSP